MPDPLNSLAADRDELARTIAEMHFQRHPELRERYGERGVAYCVKDAGYHLQYLEQALRFDNDQLFADYIRWARIMLETRRIPLADLVSNLGTVADVLAGQFPAIGDRVRRMIDTALQSLSVEPAAADIRRPHAQLADAYLRAVLNGERFVASTLINDAIAGGVSLREVYLHVFQEAQYEIGRRWQRNEISVADEHLGTAITQMIMSQLYPLLFSGPRNGRTFVSACVGGELHEIGARMVADFFEMDGWNTYYLGANTPVDGIVKTIGERRANVAGLSVTISYNIAAVEQAIRAIRSETACRDTKVIVGGYPFRIAPDLWKKIGADGYAADAGEAIALADRLIGQAPS